MSNPSALDMLLDVTLDDLADLPEFKNFQAGAHQVTCTWGTKEINDLHYVTLDFKLVETLEAVDGEEITGKAGDECGAMFNIANEFGQGNLKKAAAPFLESLGFTTIRELVEGATDIEAVIITGLKKNKTDPDKPYLDLKEVSVS